MWLPKKYEVDNRMFWVYSGWSEEAIARTAGDGIYTTWKSIAHIRYHYLSTKSRYQKITVDGARVKTIKPERFTGNEIKVVFQDGYIIKCVHTDGWAAEPVMSAYQDHDMLHKYNAYSVYCQLSMQMITQCKRRLPLFPEFMDKFNEGYGWSYDGILYKGDVGISPAVAIFDCNTPATKSIPHTHTKKTKSPELVNDLQGQKQTCKVEKPELPGLDKPLKKPVKAMYQGTETKKKWKPKTMSMTQFVSRKLGITKGKSKVLDDLGITCSVIGHHGEVVHEPCSALRSMFVCVIDTIQDTNQVYPHYEWEWEVLEEEADNLLKVAKHLQRVKNKADRRAQKRLAAHGICYAKGGFVEAHKEV